MIVYTNKTSLWQNSTHNSYQNKSTLVNWKISKIKKDYWKMHCSTLKLQKKRRKKPDCANKIKHFLTITITRVTIREMCAGREEGWGNHISCPAAAEETLHSKGEGKYAAHTTRLNGWFKKTISCLLWVMHVHACPCLKVWFQHYTTNITIHNLVFHWPSGHLFLTNEMFSYLSCGHGNHLHCLSQVH